MLGEDPSREWIEDEIRKQAQVSAGAIRSHLQELEQRGLLRCRLSETQFYCQYGPHNLDLEEKIGRMLLLYRQRPVTMIRMIYERPANALRDFAAAFRLRSKE